MTNTLSDYFRFIFDTKLSQIEGWVAKIIIWAELTYFRKFNFQ